MRAGRAGALALLLAFHPPPDAWAGAPVFDPTGPDAAEFGAGPDGFARADRANWWRIPYLVDSHSRLDELVANRPVPQPAAARALARAAGEPAISYRWAGEEFGLADYLRRNPVTGLLILHGDTILVERYQYGRRDSHRFTSWSMAKTVVAMLVGIAVEEGAIRSLDDRAAAYLPELAGTAYGDTALRHLLSMSSGIRFREEYDGKDDVSTLSRMTFNPAQAGGLAAVKGFNERAAPPGTRFSYASADTEVLSLVLAAAVKQPVADYLASRIWGPMGAEAAATWLIDGAGHEIGYCCLNAVLRDYGRLGLLLADKGRRGERQIIPAGWIDQAARPAEAYLEPGKATRFFGYGYQTWIFPGATGAFALLGVRGQSIFVDPALRLVMVNTAVRKGARDPGTGETVALWQGVRTQLRR